MNDDPVFLTPDRQPWINDRDLIAIKNAIKAAGGELRPVGGCVRDALLGRAVQDIDCAATLDPNQVMEVLGKAGIKTVPTGIDHGTVMAVVGGRGYEITTLRRDLKTDGRRAVVVFTDDWREDAARRDFTFNAMSLRDDGMVVDYFGGMEDLRTKTIRFIGDPVQRIHEDYLRILRAFRFLSQLSEEGAEARIDRESFQACVQEMAGIGTLSVQRVAKEFLLFLGGLRCLSPLNRFEEGGVMGFIPYSGKNTDILRELIMWELSHNYRIDPIRRLAALAIGGEIPRNSLMLSNKDYGAFFGLLSLAPHLAATANPLLWRQMIYDNGMALFHGAIALAAVCDEDFDADAAFSVLDAWERPQFPLSGSDLIACGIPAGTEMGRRLRDSEAFWRAGDFKADRAACLARALA